MRRREFITLVGGVAVAAWPLAARAQQPAVPVVGFLSPTSATVRPERLAAVRAGLGDAGFIENKTVKIEYRFADDQINRLPELAVDLVRLRVGAIAVAGSTPAILAAKSATTTIPIVFGIAEDPVKLGIVSSLNRPGGNATGVYFYTAELAAKRLGLLRELLPEAKHLALLVNPADISSEVTTKETEEAARTIGFQLRVLNATNGQEIDEAFVTIERERPDALYVAPDIFFNTRKVQLAILAARSGIPATFAVRDYVEAGGLMSYGTNLNDGYRQVGFYSGRILKGERPEDLPILQPSKFELVINLRTARALGIRVSPTLLPRADEVIE